MYIGRSTQVNRSSFDTVLCCVTSVHPLMSPRCQHIPNLPSRSYRGVSGGKCNILPCSGATINKEKVNYSTLLSIWFGTTAWQNVHQLS